MTTVTFYDLASRPSQLLLQLGAKFFNPVYPASTELQAYQEKEKLRSLFKKGTKILFVLLTPIAAALFCWKGEIMHLWLGPGYELSARMLPILTINYFVLALAVIPGAMMFGLDKAWILSLESLLRISLNFVLSFILIRRMGALGAAYGITLASLTTTTIFFGWMARQVGIGSKELFVELFGFPLTVLLLGFLFFVGGPLLNFSSLLRFSVFTTLFLCASLFFYIGKDEVVSLLKAMLVKSEGRA